MNAVAAPADSQVGTEYRLHRHYFWTGLFTSIGFLVACVASVWSALANVDGSFVYPEETAIGVGIFWGLFTMLGAFVLRAYYVERLLMWENRLRVIGSLHTRDVVFAEVSEAKWRGFSLVLRTPSTKAVIHFENFGIVHGWRLVDFLHNTLPVRIQTGRKPNQKHYNPTPEEQKRAWKVRRWVYGFIGLNGVVLIAIAVVNPFNDPTEHLHPLLFGTFAVAFVVYCLFRDGSPTANTPNNTTAVIDPHDSPKVSNER